jgi:hypothetical protein
MGPQDDGKPPWDEDGAQVMIGALVLVGMTRLSYEGRMIRQEQFYGRVVSVGEQEGICLRLEGERDGEHYWMPPTTEPYQRAQPGHYTLSSTGEVVKDPDYLSTWTLTEPPEGNAVMTKQ